MTEQKIKPWEMTLEEYFSNTKAMEIVGKYYGINDYLGYACMLDDAIKYKKEIPEKVKNQIGFKYIFNTSYEVLFICLIINLLSSYKFIFLFYNFLTLQPSNLSPQSPTRPIKIKSSIIMPIFASWGCKRLYN